MQLQITPNILASLQTALDFVMQVLWAQTAICTDTNKTVGLTQYFYRLMSEAQSTRNEVTERKQ